jgi:hypothetical protein
VYGIADLGSVDGEHIGILSVDGFEKAVGVLEDAHRHARHHVDGDEGIAKAVSHLRAS